MTYFSLRKSQNHSYLYYLIIFPAPRMPLDTDLDVIFMVDSSSSVTRNDFFNEKEFVSCITKALGFAPGKSRGAMITYGRSPSITFRFDSLRDLPEYRRLISSATIVDGQPRPDLALATAVDLFKDSRNSVSKIAILLTALKKLSPLYEKQVIDAAKNLRDSGVSLYVIFVGDKHELKALSSRPQDIIPVNNFVQLVALSSSIARELAMGSGKSGKNSELR